MIDDITAVGSFERNNLSIDTAGRIAVPAALRRRYNIHDDTKFMCFSGKKDGKWYLIYTEDEKTK